VLVFTDKKKAGDNRKEQATCLDDIIGVNKSISFPFPPVSLEKNKRSLRIRLLNKIKMMSLYNVGGLSSKLKEKQKSTGR